MDGFKNFLLRGNLVELAVAFIMATQFAAVVTAFTNWLMSILPGLDEVFDPTELHGVFLNALLAFIVIAAVVYFFIVVPYTKAKERFFPAEVAGPGEVELLTEIRDSLAARGGNPPQA